MRSIFLFLAINSYAQQDSGLKTGADRLEYWLPRLEGKRVAVVANQTSVIGETHLVDTLMSRGVHLVKVFSPEHGFRGNADAGEHIDHAQDERTKLPIISLYGKNKKPTDAQMKGIDLILFDLQDVGVRFYTYISTLHYVMESAAENNVAVLVLDRPNPNGHYVDGPVLEKEFTSFVGMHPVPVVYGMTIGEYALMVNGEGWLKDGVRCRVEVISLLGYRHIDSYSLPVAPSPNLRTDVAVNLYPSLCLFEGTSVSVGRGTEWPFEVYGHPRFKATGFTFTPLSGPGSKEPKLEGVPCNGIDLRSSTQRLDRFDLRFLLQARDELSEEDWITNSRFFNLLAGNARLQQQLRDGSTEAEIRDSWETGLKAFTKIRGRYLLYE